MLRTFRHDPQLRRWQNQRRERARERLGGRMSRLTNLKRRALALLLLEEFERERERYLGVRNG